MAAPTHRWRLAGLLVAAVLSTGCSLLAFPYFLLVGMHNRHEASCKLASTDKEKQVKVVVLASAGLETRAEFVRVDRELSSLVVRQLEKGFKENKENGVVVSTTKVERFKDDHPAWKAMSAVDIGRHFGADYVIDLEVLGLSLYEPLSANQLYRGKAEISVKAWDVSRPDEEPIFEKAYKCIYPKQGPIEVGNENARGFRQLFLTHIAREIAWFFTARSVDADIARD